MHERIELVLTVGLHSSPHSETQSYFTSPGTGSSKTFSVSIVLSFLFNLGGYR